MSPGFYPILVLVVSTIAPYCLLTGFVLPYTQKLFHYFNIPFETGELYIDRQYAGDIIGGILFGFSTGILAQTFRRCGPLRFISDSGHTFDDGPILREWRFLVPATAVAALLLWDGPHAFPGDAHP